MKLGIVSAIYDGFTFEEMIDSAAKIGYECAEVACWPPGKAERRYAGVSHINVENTSAEYISYINDYCAKKGVQISSLAFYPNTMDGDPERRQCGTPQKGHPHERIAGCEHGHHLYRARPDQVRGRKPGTGQGDLAPHSAAGRAGGCEDRHRKLPDAFRRRPVAGRTESVYHPCPLA